MDFEYDFYYKNNNCLILRRDNYTLFNNIRLKIVFDICQHYKNGFDIKKLFSSIKMVIKNTIIDNFENEKLFSLNDLCEWNEESLYIILLLKYSKGVVIFNECKYFKI